MRKRLNRKNCLELLFGSLNRSKKPSNKTNKLLSMLRRIADVKKRVRKEYEDHLYLNFSKENWIRRRKELRKEDKIKSLKNYSELLKEETSSRIVVNNKRKLLRLPNLLLL